MTSDTDDIAIFKHCNSSGKIVSDKVIKIKYGVPITFLFMFVRNIHDG